MNRPPVHRRKIPLLRILLLLVTMWFLHTQFTDGWLAQFWDSRADSTLVTTPLPERQLPESLDWRSWCEKRHGTVFELRDSMAQCSWSFGNSTELHDLLATESSRIAAMAAYAADRIVQGYPLRLHRLYKRRTPDGAGLLELSTRSDTLRLIGIPDSVGMVWLNAATGCAFPGPCPHTPLEGGAVAIPADFDFAGHENLLSRDLFRAIGESPVFPILPARILTVEKTQQGFLVELDHGDNLYSRFTGIASLYNGMEPGKLVSTETPIGRLSAQDTATMHFEMLRNGKFIRWEDFWNQTHPVEPGHFATFRQEIGY